MDSTNGTLMVFCKAPQPGYVKTRLASSIGDELAALLHEKLALHCLQRVTGLASLKIELWCSPSSDHAFFRKCAKEYGVTLEDQGAGNLGDRMSRAFSSILSRDQFALVIGTDCPAINNEYILQAISAISENKRTVIGPAEDGGYVLLGLRESQSTYFKNISWGTDRVLQETLQQLPENTIQLPLMWDIDNSDDLMRLQQSRDDLSLSNELNLFLDSIK